MKKIVCKMNIGDYLRRSLGSRTLVDKHGKIGGEELGLGVCLRNLAGFLLRREAVLPILVGILCWHGGRAYCSKDQAGYYPKEAVVYEGELQIDKEFQLLREPNSPDNCRIYKRWDQFSKP